MADENSTSLRAFQKATIVWVTACLGSDVLYDKRERRDRLLEEATELFQAADGERERAHAMVDYVFDRPKGDLPQEIGGTANCLAALCEAYDVELELAALDELDRCWKNMDKIRAKQAGKASKLLDIEGRTKSSKDLAEVLLKILDRARNGELGSSKVQDIIRLAEEALK